MNTAHINALCVALIDIGNTRIKIGWTDPRSGQREYRALAVEHLHLEHITAWFADQQLEPTSAVGVNVAGPLKAQAMEDLFRHRFGLSIQWLDSQRQAASVFNRYTNPRQLGADRWMSMIGLSQASSERSVPLLLASFGTATTLDTLCPVKLATSTGHAPPCMDADTEWIYDGGLIFPGPALMRSSLANHTAQLPEAQGQATAFPLDTHQAIATGIAAAQAGAVIRQWLAVLGRYGIPPQVYCTGGGWPVVETEAQALLAQAQTLHGRSLHPMRLLASPILDGLACLSRNSGGH